MPVELRLALVRHAKSARKPHTDDHARPLNEHGRRDAPRVGRRLFELGWLPQAAVSSDARRARETWELMAPSFGGVEIPALYTPMLYLAGIAEIRRIAELISVECRELVLVGHNPGWEEALAELCGVERPMATCDAALLEGRGRTWAEALCERWTLAAYVSARGLEELTEPGV